MAREVLKFGVVAQSRPPVTKWAGRQVRPYAVLPSVPDVAPHTLLSNEDGIETWYLGAHDLILHTGDTSHYQDNLMSRRPGVWVVIPEVEDARKADIQLITVDPYEGEGLALDTGVVVEVVGMPDALRMKLEDFVARHHVEIPFKKRKRKPVDVEADPRAPRILQPQDKWVRK